jgi:hypothetical protein
LVRIKINCYIYINILKNISSIFTNLNLKKMKKLALLIVVVLFSVSAILIAQKPIKTDAAGDKHPHMHAAKKKCIEAVDQLKKSATVYGGHRVKAINLIEEAIKEIDLGLAAEGAK